MIELRDVSYSVPDDSGETASVPDDERRDDERPDDERRDGQELADSSSGDGNSKTRSAKSKSQKLILDHVSFIVPDRSITCIMGVSGTGKTTLLRLIAGLLKPDAGEILVDGRDIVPLDERELNEVRREMGFVFQYGALFDSMTVGENVGFGLEQQRRPKSEIREIVAARLGEVGLPEVADKLPSELSGGMRKRVAMARALATNPKIVLYDEPTSGLDPVMARVIDDLVVHLRDSAGTTNVVVSHHLPSIFRIADRVLMLHNAKLAAQGTPTEVQDSQDEAVRQFLDGKADGPITVR